MEIFQKSQFWGVEVFKNRNFGRNFQKILILVDILNLSRFWSKFCKILDFERNLQQISVLDEILENLDFGRNFQQILIVVEIFEKSRTWSIFFEKSPF